MRKNIEEIFAREKSALAFRRINSTHPSDLYLGYNENGGKALVIVEISDEKKVESSQIIHTQLYLREDGKTSLEFVLKDNKFETMFYRLCEDIITSTSNVKRGIVIGFVIKRWNAWKTAFQKLSGERLSDMSIMGLIGELTFMEQVMIPKYGIDRSIVAWEGPDGGHKDYVINSTWYEIKSTTLSSDTVKISSIEQLDSDKEGFCKLFDWKRQTKKMLMLLI